MAEVKIRVRTIDESSGIVSRIQTGWQSFGIAMASVTAGLVVAKQVYDATVSATMAYAREVRDLSIVTGESAERTSRLVQVLDDFEISGETLTAAMRALRTQGISPTVDSLAAMSDRFLALNPGLERQNFLAENFGARIGPQFANMMLQGGAAIRERGEAVSDSLILDAAAIRKSEEFRLAVDELNDEFFGLKVTIGTTVIPIILDLIDEMGHAERAARELDAGIEDIGPGAKGAALGVDDLVSVFGNMRSEAHGLRRDFEVIGWDEATAGAGHLTQALLDEAIAAAEARDRTSEVQRVIDNLRDKHITITVGIVEMVTQWQQAQGNVTTSAWHPYQPTAPSSGHYSMDQQAAGGPLGPITEVGEAGTEGIINGIVIPHGQWERMKRLGLVPDRGLMYGSEDGWPGPIKKPVVKGYPPNLPPKDYTSSGLGGTLTPTGGGGASISSAIAQIQASNAQQNAVLAASIPAAAASAASQQGRQQVNETKRIGADTVAELRLVRQEIARLNRTLPTLITSAVERIL